MRWYHILLENDWKRLTIWRQDHKRIHLNHRNNRSPMFTNSLGPLPLIFLHKITAWRIQNNLILQTVHGWVIRWNPIKRNQRIKLIIERISLINSGNKYSIELRQIRIGKLIGWNNQIENKKKSQKIEVEK